MSEPDYAVVGHCPLCGQGRLFIAVESASKDSFVMCEDCESIWEKPEHSSDIGKIIQDEPDCVDFLLASEIQGHKWEQHVINKRDS